MEHKEGLIVGRNAVLQALESGRTIDSVTVAQGQRGGQAGKIIDICRERKIPVKFADARKLDRLCDGAAHQGVAAFAAAHEYAELDDIFAHEPKLQPVSRAGPRQSRRARRLPGILKRTVDQLAQER